jgi:hypothetical protein
MKRLLVNTICVVAIFSFLGGCSSTESSEKPTVNSGTLDKEYVGDADVKLIENYKQTTEEAEMQAEILKKIEENESSKTESEGLGGHF